MNWQHITDTILVNKVRFTATFFIVFIVLYTFLFIIDFLPEAPIDVAQPAAATELVESQVLDTVTSSPLNIETVAQEIEEEELVEEVTTAPQVDIAANQPVSMYIEALDRTVTVLNPQGRSIAALDTALLGGVVRHPDSAMPNQDGNVFILGHSSYLPNVFNRNFQAFNGIENLRWGDTITLTSANTVYTYRVEKVYQAKASEVVVPINGTGKMLTLATCNSFGSTDDRHMVEATLVSSTPR